MVFFKTWELRGPEAVRPQEACVPQGLWESRRYFSQKTVVKTVGDDHTFPPGAATSHSVATVHQQLAWEGGRGCG